jgi:glucose-1-phosphate thymidylyltransferase
MNGLRHKNLPPSPPPQEAQYAKAGAEEGQGYRICCPEEIAFRQGFISRDSLAQLGHNMEQTGYGQYLLGIAEKSD